MVLCVGPSGLSCSIKSAAIFDETLQVVCLQRTEIRRVKDL